MPEFALRPKARADLDGIWDYTVETWGRDQAKAYLRALNRAFKTLARKPGLGRVYDEVYEGLRVYPSGKHLIFYFASDNGIDIVRVLHERMDIPSRL
ncbi:MAG: type II toxin-antitoxin system RelE/ParE family toxin [Acidobacteriota bacterium]